MIILGWRKIRLRVQFKSQTISKDQAQSLHFEQFRMYTGVLLKEIEYLKLIANIFYWVRTVDKINQYAHNYKVWFEIIWALPGKTSRLVVLLKSSDSELWFINTNSLNTVGVSAHKTVSNKNKASIIFITLLMISKNVLGGLERIRAGICISP